YIHRERDRTASHSINAAAKATVNSIAVGRLARRQKSWRQSEEGRRGTWRAIEHESLLQRGCRHAFLVRLRARFYDDVHTIARFLRWTCWFRGLVSCKMDIVSRSGDCLLT